jgi:DNA polymerase-3 subunit alpha
LIPEKLGISLEEAIETEPRLRELMDNEPRIATLMDLAQRIEGLTRHASIHAAGVVIADKPLVQHAPLYKGADGENVIQYDMKMAEKIGLIKFDFLGLKNLTILKQALSTIERVHGEKIDLSRIPLDDKKTFAQELGAVTFFKKSDDLNLIISTIKEMVEKKQS